MIYSNHQLSYHNPWWDNSYNIEADVNLMELTDQKYQYKHPLLDSFPLNLPCILSLRGPRRIGKTTLLKQLISLLIEKKVPRQDIMHLPCDRIENFNELYSILKSYITERLVSKPKNLYLFIDEISFTREWQRGIKSLADEGLLRNATVLITGSNAIDLKVSSERLPGRTGKYFLPDKLFLPLSFHGFYKLLHKDWDGKYHFSDIPRYRKYFRDYMLVGGFPGVINEYYRKGIILPETYETYIRWIDGDLYKSGKSPENAYHLFAALEKNLSSRVSYINLAQDCGLSSQKTVQEYLEVFEMMFITFKCPFLSLEQKRTDIKKNKKIYFLDPFIHNALIANEQGFLGNAFEYSKKVLLSEQNMPKRFEEVIGASLFKKYDKLFYGSTGRKEKEIDFVGQEKGAFDLFEVKYGKVGDLNKYKEILGKNKKLKVITSNSKGKEGKIEAIPYYEFLLG